MGSTSKISFLPSYSYKVKKTGIFFLTASILLLIYFLLTKNDIRVSSWLIAFSLSIITFSKDKDYSDKDVLLKYYSLKLIFSFFIGFILATHLVYYMIGKDVELNLIYLLIFILIIYQICYHTLRYLYKRNEIEIIENGVIKTLNKNSKLHFIIFIISIISLSIIYILC